MSAGEILARGELSVASVNAACWPTPAAVRRRARRGLRPIEAALITRYRDQMSGSVLEIGSRGDGLTEVLHHYAADLTGVAFSTPEVELCRARYPDGSFARRNLVDLNDFADEQFDAVVAGRFALDALTHEQREDFLHRVTRILAGDGVLILSSHSLARESRVRAPLHEAMLSPWTLWRLPRALLNRSRLGPLQQRAHGYALLNDPSDSYGRLTYHVSCQLQEEQLLAQGLELLECVDRSDCAVSHGSEPATESELHFVAQLSC
jgi:SAM-dependent methyltransferase